jgi:hypothetical protein
LHKKYSITKSFPKSPQTPTQNKHHIIEPSTHFAPSHTSPKPYTQATTSQKYPHSPRTPHLLTDLSFTTTSTSHHINHTLHLAAILLSLNYSYSYGYGYLTYLFSFKISLTYTYTHTA